MREIIALSPEKSNLGKRVVTPGNIERFRADFTELLGQDAIIASVTAAVTGGTTTVGTPTLADDSKAIYFILSAASVDETVTLTITIVTNDGQTLKFTATFQVGAG